MKNYIGVSMVTAEPAYKGTELGFLLATACSNQ